MTHIGFVYGHIWEICTGDTDEDTYVMHMVDNIQEIQKEDSINIASNNVFIYCAN